jgi:hypothetical protein
MGRWGFGLGVVFYCALLPIEARAAGPVSDPLAAACHAGHGFSALGDQIFRREADVLALMGQESSMIGPLEKKKSKFELLDQTMSAAEFSIASLSLNAVVMKAMGSAGPAVNSVQAVATANNMATLRQAINATIGTAGIVWAASYHSDYGDFLPDGVGAQDIEKAQLKEEVSLGFARDRAYVSAQRHLSLMVDFYTKLDNSIRLREIEQHKLHADLNWASAVEQTEQCNEEYRLGAEFSSCDSERMWRLLKYVLPGTNYFHQKAQDTMIDLSAAQTHIKLYLDELRFLSGLYGQLLAHCELRNDQLAKGKGAPSAQSIWDGMVAASKQIKQLPNGQTAPELPALASRAK